MLRISPAYVKLSDCDYNFVYTGKKSTVLFLVLRSKYNFESNGKLVTGKSQHLFHGFTDHL